MPTTAYPTCISYFLVYKLIHLLCHVNTCEVDPIKACVIYFHTATIFNGYTYTSKIIIALHLLGP